MRTAKVPRRSIASRKYAHKDPDFVGLSKSAQAVYRRCAYYAIEGQKKGFPLRPPTVADLIASLPDSLLVGSCFACVGGLARGGRRDGELARRTVQYALRELERRGLLVPYHATTIGVRRYLVLRQRCPTGAWLGLRDRFGAYELDRAAGQPGTRTLELPEDQGADTPGATDIRGADNARGCANFAPNISPDLTLDPDPEDPDQTPTHTDRHGDRPLAEPFDASAGPEDAGSLSLFPDPETGALLDGEAATRRGVKMPPSRRDSDGAAGVYYVK